MSYNRPIIAEIYAELYLEPGTLPFDRVVDLLPAFRRQGLSEVEPGESLELEVNSPAGGIFKSRTQRIRCWSPDRSRLVQVAPDNLVMNLVSPDGSYPGWEAFLAEIAMPTVRTLTESVPSWRPNSVALNTIDRAAIGYSPEFRLGDYLNCGGPRIPAVLADTAVAFDYDIGRGLLPSDGRNRQIHIVGRVVGDIYLIQMNAVFHDRIVQGAEFAPTLERLHDDSSSSFESLITQRMRDEVMAGERKHANTHV